MRQNGMRPRTGILTIDVEEWFHAHNYTRKVPKATWEEHERRAPDGVDRILRLCDDLGIRATFFIVGWTAQRDPQLVREIHAAGHEIGCHSYGHPVVYELDAKRFREDTRRAREVLAEILGEPPRAYRAPSFTIVPRSYWALEILREEGFRIDSSIFPVSHPRYGNPRGPRHPFRLGPRNGLAEGGSGASDPRKEELLVLPMPTLRIPGRNIPFSGGGYFRLFPLALLRACAHQVQRRQSEPVVYYFHPWELDSYVPDVDLGWLQNLRSQGGKVDLHEKLCRALSDQRMITLGEWADMVWDEVTVLRDVSEISPRTVKSRAAL